MNSRMSVNENGVTFKDETDPKLVTMDIYNFINTDNIRLYSIFMENIQIRLRFFY